MRRSNHRGRRKSLPKRQPRRIDRLYPRALNRKQGLLFQGLALEFKSGNLRPFLPDEVVAASNGRTQSITEAPGSSYDGMAAHTAGTYRLGGLTLPVKFYYGNDRLSMVMLKGERDGVCYALRTLLDQQGSQEASSAG